MTVEMIGVIIGINRTVTITTNNNNIIATTITVASSPPKPEFDCCIVIKNMKSCLAQNMITMAKKGRISAGCK
jgi:hypothetical protein